MIRASCSGRPTIRSNCSSSARSWASPGADRKALGSSSVAAISSSVCKACLISGCDDHNRTSFFFSSIHNSNAVTSALRIVCNSDAAMDCIDCFIPLYVHIAREPNKIRTHAMTNSRLAQLPKTVCRIRLVAGSIRLSTRLRDRPTCCSGWKGGLMVRVKIVSAESCLISEVTS